MNINNISPKFTASSILKQTQNEEVKNKAQETEIKDTVERSVSEKFDFLKISPAKKKGIKIGAGVGAAIGGITGGMLAYNSSWNEIKSTNALRSITLDWQEPDMKPQNLGKIPADYYTPVSQWGIGISVNNGTQNITRDNPVLNAKGKPQMHDVQKTFTDYGEPIVKWKSNDIEQSRLQGYTQSQIEDYHFEHVPAGKDANGNQQYVEVKRTDGYWHRFTPDIRTTSLGTYQTPKVTFETGVNVGLNTFLGVLGGAGLGTLVGATAGAMVASVLEEK